MAVQLEGSISRYRGLSTDVKPGHSSLEVGEKLQTPRVGSIFTEIDTGSRYVWNGSWPWVRQEQTIEATLALLIDVNQQVLEMLAAIKVGHEEYLWGHEIATED